MPNEWNLTTAFADLTLDKQITYYKGDVRVHIIPTAFVNGVWVVSVVIERGKGQDEDIRQVDNQIVDPGWIWATQVGLERDGIDPGMYGLAPKPINWR